jgi:hypothetical protein
MRPALRDDVLHNPFNNRFNDPVTRRHDEMQAYAHMVWLRERNQCSQSENGSQSSITKQGARISEATKPRNSGRIFGSAFALFLVVLVVVLLRVV